MSIIVYFFFFFSCSKMFCIPVVNCKSQLLTNQNHCFNIVFIENPINGSALKSNGVNLLSLRFLLIFFYSRHGIFHTEIEREIQSEAICYFMCYHAILFGICLRIMDSDSEKKINTSIYTTSDLQIEYCAIIFFLNCFIFLCTFYRRLTPLFFVHKLFVRLFACVFFSPFRLHTLFYYLVLHYFEIATYLISFASYVFSFFNRF